MDALVPPPALVRPPSRPSRWSRAGGPVLASTAADVADWGTILGVWAHPDDEAYLSAGLMALAVEAGSRVVCVTATKGERGTDDPVVWPPERLARRRSEELAVSLTALGVVEHRWLGHRDGACASVPREWAAAPLVGVIDEVQPDTIVTFGPDGFTGHDDHIAVSHWVDEAVARAARPPERVWWAAAAESWVDRHRSLHREVPVFGPDGPVVVPDVDLDAVVAPDDTILDRKMAALRAQRSQTRGLIERVGEATYRSWWSREYFVAAS
jgi:LmbE family N-acetylglucosaminyl deacetylase